MDVARLLRVSKDTIYDREHDRLEPTIRGDGMIPQHGSFSDVLVFRTPAGWKRGSIILLLFGNRKRGVSRAYGMQGVWWANMAFSGDFGQLFGLCSWSCLLPLV